MERVFNFQNPEVQRKATQKAKVSLRPKKYFSRRKRVAQAKMELTKEALIREGFLNELEGNVPKIVVAMVKNACSPTPKGTADRRIIFQALGLLEPEDRSTKLPTAGEMLSRIFANANPNEHND